MTNFVRDQNKIIFQFESGTYGAGSGASGTWLGLVTAHSPTESENLVEIRYAGTNSRNFGQQVPGPRDYEGTISFHPQDFRMLGFALGSTQNISGTTNQHLITELDSSGRYAFTSGTNQLTNFPSFTVIDSKGGQPDGQNAIRTYAGAVIDTYTLTATQSEPISCEVKYKAQSMVLGSKTAQILNIYDQDSTRPYIWSDVTFQLPSGTNFNEVNEIEYNVENNVEARHYVNGSRVVQAMIPTMRNHTLTLTLDPNTNWFKTLTDFYMNGSIFNAQMLLTQNSSTEYGAFTFSGCVITELETASEVEGLDSTSVTIRPQSVSFTGSDTVRLYNPY